MIVFLSANVACQKYHATQANLKKAEKEVPTPLSYQERKKLKNSLPPQRIANSWHQRLQEWALLCRQISKEESEVRNYRISEKFSALDLLWSGRASEIKDASPSEASLKVKAWLQAVTLPELPAKPRYYVGQDAYESILKTYHILESVEDRECAVSKGFAFMDSFLQMDYALDLLNEKLYQKSLLQSQKTTNLGNNVPLEFKCGDTAESGESAPSPESEPKRGKYGKKHRRKPL